MDAHCGFGRLFSRCRRPVGAICQYCGRGYCDQHGSLGAADEQICARERCQAKVVDLAAHLIFRERALLRNRHGLCGIEGCMEERSGQCSKCEGTYCEQHLWDGTETVREGIVRFTRPAAFCEHCRARRKLWSKL
jgi:hypothetical protein